MAMGGLVVARKELSSNNIESGSLVKGDNPIENPQDDALERLGVALSFAKQVLMLDASQGTVVGVLGPWGSGKTSFINLARSEFTRAHVPVLDFNPWMFSGAEQLVESFFVELAAQLKARPDFAQVGQDLAEYGEMFSGMAWLPVIGPWIQLFGGAAKILGAIAKRRKEGVGGRRDKLRKTLAGLAKPIIVVLDDIDRLSGPEIRDVFKLVRLTASFPNIVYILAFDRARVEAALEEQGVPGRDYLEKILQLTIDLPEVAWPVLSRQILSSINSALAGVPKSGHFDEQAWPDVFMEIVRPLIRNMRDVRRYAVAIRGTVEALNGEVALVDVLALEAIRIFIPDAFRRLHSSMDALTSVSDLAYRGRGDSPKLKAGIDALIGASGAQGDVIGAMIKRLFPAAERHIGGSHYGHEWTGQWLRERRVAHEEILKLYLERVAGEGLRAFVDAEHAFTCMDDCDALGVFMRSLDPERLRDVIGQLEVFEDRYKPEHVVPTTIVLLNLLPDIPEKELGFFEFDTALVVTRVTYRLLRSLKDVNVVEAAVSQIMPKVKYLSLRLQLIDCVGYREGAGHKLVSETAATELEKAWVKNVRSATADQLARERDLLRVLMRARQYSDPADGPLAIDESPYLTYAILRSARSEVRSQAMDSRAVRRWTRLAWDALVDLYGGEATLGQRIESLISQSPDDPDDLLSLAQKYLSGWRPVD